jgi:hypothetical protein
MHRAGKRAFPRRRAAVNPGEPPDIHRFSVSGSRLAWVCMLLLAGNTVAKIIEPKAIKTSSRMAAFVVPNQIAQPDRRTTGCTEDGESMRELVG